MARVTGMPDVPRRYWSSCAACRAEMHPAQNCRRIAVGVVCMACYDREQAEPRYLRHPPPADNPELN